MVIASLLIAFLGFQCLLPLATAVKIGADEDFELSKATLCSRGYHLYTEIWDDQPPLDTFIITQILQHVSSSVLGPRLLTVGFGALLLLSLFILVRRSETLLAAGVATAMCLASPGFLELSSSCMQEVPALAPAVAGLALLWVGPRTKWFSTEILGGLLFGFALQMKVLDALYLPLAGLVIWLRSHERTSPIAAIIRQLFIFGMSVILSFVFLNSLTGNSLLFQFQQAWAAHFANTRSFEYGSPADRPFDWAVLLRNWDVTIPALIGIWFLVREIRQRSAGILPLAWLALTLGVLSLHKPWWAYYYVHTAIPLCWCAGIGISRIWSLARIKRTWVRVATVSLLVLPAAGWMSARLYLEEVSVRSSKRLYSCLVLKEIERYKPFATFMFSDQPIYSFHAQIPMPAHLAVISLKRLWSGDMTNAKLKRELATAKPGLILLENNGLEVPYQDFLNHEYRMVYRDDANRLYAHVSIAWKPGF